MAKLPERRKATVLPFRRANPDEVLLVVRHSKGKDHWTPPSVEAAPGERWEDAARRATTDAARDELTTLLDLDVEADYSVKAGPSAGAWTERFFGAEIPEGSSTIDGEWFPHYDAKARSSSPRVRDALSALRARAGLKP